MTVLSVIPDDPAALANLPRDRFEFPANSSFGRAVTRLAAKLTRPGGTDSTPKSLSRKAA